MKPLSTFRRRLHLRRQIRLHHKNKNTTHRERRGLTSPPQSLEHMITFEIGNSNTLISNIEEESTSFIHELNRHLSFQEHDYQFTWRYKNTPWDGRHYLLSGKWQSGLYIPSVSLLKFRTGLLPHVLKFCEEKGVAYTVFDNRNFPQTGNPLRWVGKLRDYQEEAIDKFIAAKRGILAAATGSGKSLIITNVVSRLNLKSVILCGTIDLVRQMHEHLSTEIPDAEIGMVGDGLCDIKRVTVSTWQSAAKSVDKKKNVYFYDNRVSEKFNASDSGPISEMLKEAEFIIVDESHCARAETVQTILKFADAPYVLGTSATPVRDEGDDLLIQAELGDIFYNISASTLIEKNWLMRPTIEYYYLFNEPLEFPNNRPKAGEEFHAIYRNYIVENEKRNGIICTKAREMVKEGRKVLILVDYLEAHGKLLEDMLLDINAEFLHAKVSSRKRINLIKAFRGGDIDCMIATSLADEGLDVPIISGEILAGGKRGKTKVKQRVGRALRPHTGKKDAKIIDFIDDGKFVLDHSIARMASLKTEPLFKLLAYNIPSDRKAFIQGKVARAIENNEQRNRSGTQKPD